MLLQTSDVSNFVSLFHRHFTAFSLFKTLGTGPDHRPRIRSFFAFQKLGTGPYHRPRIHSFFAFKKLGTTIPWAHESTAFSISKSWAQDHTIGSQIHSFCAFKKLGTEPYHTNGVLTWRSFATESDIVEYVPVPMRVVVHRRQKIEAIRALLGLQRCAGRSTHNVAAHGTVLVFFLEIPYL